MSSEILCPFVYWAQDATHVFLKVDVRDVKFADVAVDNSCLKFSANGWGAKGHNKYEFTIDFYGAVISDESQYQISDRHVAIEVFKVASDWWPRVTAKPQKPAWLKVDFDRWKHEDETEEDEEGEDVTRDVMKDYKDIYSDLMKEERGYRVEDLRKVYLFLYSLFQLVGYLYIIGVLVVRYARHSEHSIPDAYDNVGWIFKMCLLTSWLEVLHPALGFVKGNVIHAFIQVGGRSIILFALISAEPRMQEKPVVFYLFLTWGVIELVRYPYYMFQVYNVNFSILTWLRYTIWIPLYPIGFICEGVVILRSIPYVEETKRYTISLPNWYNFAFHFPTVMRCYLLFFFFPLMYMMMAHMYRQRSQKIGPKQRK